MGAAEFLVSASIASKSLASKNWHSLDTLYHHIFATLHCLLLQSKTKLPLTNIFSGSRKFFDSSRQGDFLVDDSGLKGEPFLFRYFFRRGDTLVDDSGVAKGSAVSFQILLWFF